MDKSANKSHPKAASAEEKAKQHLISVGLYGRSVSIISNAFRLTSIIRSYAEKHVFKEFNLSFSGFVVMWVLWVWGDLETAKLAKNSGIAKSTLTGILITLEKHGYCQRLAHSNDARRVVVHITCQLLSLLVNSSIVRSIVLRLSIVVSNSSLVKSDTAISSIS